MSRPTLGVEHVDKLAGERESKLRLKWILMSMSGEASVNEAAERIGVCVSRFHELRDEALTGALESLAPKAVGRPPSAHKDSLRVLDLERELDRTRYMLEVERVRTELLVVMPEVVSGKWSPLRAKSGGRGGDGKRTRG